MIYCEWRKQIGEKVSFFFLWDDKSRKVILLNSLVLGMRNLRRTEGGGGVNELVEIWEKLWQFFSYDGNTRTHLVKYDRVVEEATGKTI